MTAAAEAGAAAAEARESGTLVLTTCLTPSHPTALVAPSPAGSEGPTEASARPRRPADGAATPTAQHHGPHPPPPREPVAREEGSDAVTRAASLLSVPTLPAHLTNLLAATPVKAAGMRAALPAWRAADAALVDVVAHGVPVPLTDTQRIALEQLSVQRHAEADARERRMPADQQAALRQIIDAGEADGEFIAVPQAEEGWILIHPIFLLPKPNAAPPKPPFRLIHDVRAVCECIELPHTWNDSLANMRARVPRGSWLTTIDAAAAYRHLAIDVNAKRWLGLRALGRVYVASAAPFGLNASAYWWGRVAKAATAAARLEWPVGCTAAVWCDDWLLIADTYDRAVEQRRLFLATLRSLGLCANLDKLAAQPVPAQRTVFVGFVWDSAMDRLFLTETASAKVAAALRVMQSSAAKPLNKRHWQRVAGLLSFWRAACPALRVAAACAFRRLNQWMQTPDGDAAGAATEEEREHMAWLEPLLGDMVERGAPLYISSTISVAIVLCTDASESGCGAHWSAASGVAQPRTFGALPISSERALPASISNSSAWSSPTATSPGPPAVPRPAPPETEQRWAAPLTASEVGTSSTARELAAVLGVMLQHGHAWRGQTLQLRCDSAAAVGAINNAHSQAGDVWRLVVRIHRCAATNGFELAQAMWVSRTFNELADDLSRVAEHAGYGEWSVQPGEYQRLCAALSCTPTVDHFASALNTKCARWSGRWPAATAAATDALTTSWGEGVSYWAPPFQLLERVVARLREQPSARGMLIVPAWSRAAWWTPLMSMAVQTVAVNQQAIEPGPSGHCEATSAACRQLLAVLVRARV